MTDPVRRNRLATETSPYLLQHAANPVDWYPWGQEALNKAREEDKPILLSIGYSACHWCHVMERESFENASVAQLMNERFVNIKVDREERPDLDQLYMSAVQLMTGAGGWPLTVFLTPDGEPFYGGTYFPPEDRYNRPGFRRVLSAISEAYRDQRTDVTSNARKVIDQISAQARQSPGNDMPDIDLLEAAAHGIASRFDVTHGGFGPAPKFPSSMVIDFLLRFHERTRDPEPLKMANLTLEKMALGGLYDQVGGGFHRYSTDERWLVPHFEKMLYDNALLARVYLDAFRLTRHELYRDVVEDTLDFVARELRDPAGGFYSTLDADSEGVEGKFYVWDRDEFREVVGADAELLSNYYDVTPPGNFEGHNILNIKSSLTSFAEREQIPVESLRARVSEARRKLYDRRRARVRPERDEKILTDWNGLMLRTYAQAAATLGSLDYAEIAIANAQFLLDHMWNGRLLLHAFTEGRGRFNGYLDDYANLVDGLVSLYELTFDDSWLHHAVSIAERMIGEFQDPQGAGLFFTGQSHETLIARTKEFFDNATPSGNSVAADVLLRLGVLLDREDFRETSSRICSSVTDYIRRFPSAFGRMLVAVDFLVGPSRQLALVGNPTDFLRIVREAYVPRLVTAAGESDTAALLRGRTALNGKPTAYLCEEYVCLEPTTDPTELSRQLLKR